MSDVKWTRDQLRAISARDSSVLVSAAAGSGKTAVLVERLLRRITGEGRDVTDFLIITYTKAAAGELRRKIYEALSKYAALHPGDRHIRRQVALVGSARISTVHSFCTWLLRNFSDNPALATGFRVLDENEAQLILEEELGELIEEKYDERGSGFLALSEYLSGARSDKELFGAVLEMYRKSMSHPYPEKWLSDAAAAYDVSGKESITDTVWGEYAFTAAKQALRNCIKILDLMIGDVEKSPEASEVYAEVLCDERDMLRGADCDTWDGLLEAVSEIEFPRLPSSRKIEDKSIPERIRAMHDLVKSECSAITEKFLTASSDELLSELSSLYSHICVLSELATELSRRFGKEKLRRGALDYSDLEHYAIELLADEYDEERDIVVPSDTAREVSKNFCEILLDEFQDSNNIQDIIFRAVSQEEKNIVMVGDVKQSIYRFRLADPTIFMKKYKSFKKYEDANGDEPRYITLSQNFRSRAEVLDASNAFFSRLMSEELGDVDYTKEHFLVPRENIPDAGAGDKSCEFYLIDRKESERSSAEDEARFVASKIRELIEDGFEVCDKDGTHRCAEYRDFAVLLRSVSGSAEIYERAFRDAGIPYTSPRAEGLLSKSEVNTIVSYLSVIDNPTSDIPLLALLKSPLFAFSADDLCYIRREEDGALIYAMEKLAAKENETAKKCREFLAELAALRSLSRGVSASSLIWEIYNRTNALGLFGALPCGEERQRNLIEFYKCAGAFEGSGYFGLYRFVSHIARLAERGGDIPAPAASAENSVTIMTIHKSKGLEFPIVFLGGCIRNFNTDDIRHPILIHPKLGVGLRFRDAEAGKDYSTVARDVIADALISEMKSEEMRILYVALTRAREKLYLIASHNDAAKMIGKIIFENVYDELDKKMLLSRVGTQTWFMLPLLRTSSGNELRQYAGFLPLDGESLGGIKTHVVPATEAEPAAFEDEEEKMQSEENADEIRKMLDFRYGHIAATETPSKLTATGLHSGGGHIAPRRRKAPRPAFLQERELTPTERGTALHMAMQFADFEKCQSVEGSKEELSRMVREKYLSKSQADAVDVRKIAMFTNSPTGTAMLSAKNVAREFKFSVLLPADEVLDKAELSGEQVLLQGVMDMYYETEDGVTIVDFKTDRRRPEGEVLEKYSAQLRTYRRALYEMTGKKAKSLRLYLVNYGEYIEVE